MRLFSYRIENQKLYITLPSGKIIYNELFIDELMYMAKIICYNKYTDIHLKYEKVFQAENIVKAALCGTLDILKSHIDAKIWVPRSFNEKVRANIHRKCGQEFTRHTLKDMVSTDRLNYYLFTDKKLVPKAVRNISELIARENIVSNAEEYEDFLTTVIGEIFANSMMHSQQDEILLIFDVSFENQQFYLDVLILDYGRTIQENVQKYFLLHGNLEPSPCNSVEWAMEFGHTTREGSGGYGLPMMRKYIKIMNGMMEIISGDVHYTLTQGREKTEYQEGYWPGTNVIFRIKLLDTDHIIRFEHSGEDVHSISLMDI